MLFQRHQPPGRFVQITDELIGGRVNLNDAPDARTAGYEGLRDFRLHGRERVMDGLLQTIQLVLTVQCKRHGVYRVGYTTGCR